MNRKIRIFFLIDQLLTGGTEKQLILLVNNLDRSRFDPVLGLLVRQKDDLSDRVKIPVVSFEFGGPPVLRTISILWRLHQYLRRERFDIVQAQFPDSTVYAALAIRLLSNKPQFVAVQRNLYHWATEQPVKFRLLKWTKRWTDLVIANSHSAAEACHVREGVPKKKIRVVYNAVEMEKLNGIPKTIAKQRLGLEDKYPVVGVLSNLRPIKGIDCFLRAAALAAQDVPKAHFVIAGSGPQEHELKQLTVSLGLDDRVSFLGDVQDIGSVLASFDIAVQPSLSESLSNSLLEYMAGGRPAVATRTGDAERIVKNGVSGILIRSDTPSELCSAIRRLTDDPEKADQMADRAKRNIASYCSPRSILNEYEKIYAGISQQK